MSTRDDPVEPASGSDEEDTSDAGPEGRSDDGVQADPTSGPTVLVVEDRSDVRTISRLHLETEGYRVLEAKDAEAARATVEAGHTVDVIVSDVVMPGERGTDLVAHLRRTRPDLPAILMSGYDREHLADDLGDAVFLAKPFQRDELLEAVRAALDAQPGPPSDTGRSPDARGRGRDR